MARQKGLWMAYGGGAKSAKVASSIENRETFTDVLSASEDAPKVAELVLVSLDGDAVDYLGISQEGRQVATDAVTVRVSNLVPLGGIDIASLRERLPSRQKDVFLPTHGTVRVSPRAWEELLKAVLEASPEAADALDGLHERVSTARRGRVRLDGGLVALERDAVGLALEAWGGPDARKKVLRSARPAPASPAPFLEQLAQATLREDTQVINDQGVFPGFDVVMRYRVGAAEFQNASGETLTIINANRMPLEQTLGVDLIYYTHRFKAFTLIQYKRMTSANTTKPVYHSSSDRSFESELERIAIVEGALALETEEGRTRHLDDFRLSEQPFFFKFCEATTRGPLDPSMISGMYVPVDLVRAMLAQSIAGGRKGLIVRWGSCPRRFSNTEFTKLLRTGWIGTSTARTEALSNLIEEILGSGRMVVYAAASRRTDEEYKRDDEGRFAAEDDPLASY